MPSLVDPALNIFRCEIIHVQYVWIPSHWAHALSMFPVFPFPLIMYNTYVHVSISYATHVKNLTSVSA